MSDKFEVGRITPLPVNQVQFETVKMPKLIARIIREYLNEHREDILDKMNDFGYLGAVLMWFDALDESQLKINAERIIYPSLRTYTGDPEDGFEIEYCPGCQCYHGCHTVGCPTLPQSEDFPQGE